MFCFFPDLTVEAVPFVDNTRVKWSATHKNNEPTNQKQGSNNLQNIVTNIVQLGKNDPDFGRLLQSSSVVIPLDNLQLLNGVTQVNERLPPAFNTTVSNPSTSKKIVKISETRQNPVRRTNTIRRTNTVQKKKFPKSNAAIYIPTSVLSRIRRQTPKGFLVVPVMNTNNNSSQNTARLQLPNINNGSILLVVRKNPSNSKPTGNSQPNVGLGNSNNSSVLANRQDNSNQPVGLNRIQSPASVPTAGSVNLNTRPLSIQRNSNLPIRTAVNVQPGSVRQFQNINRGQSVQPRRQVNSRQVQTQPAVTPQGQITRQAGQISGIVSRNRPLVQTVSSNGRFPRTQSLQTGQRLRNHPLPAVRRVSAMRRRPTPPPDPFTRRFSAGFTRGSNFLVQPPFENTTIFNADGTRVEIDSDINGNVIRRTLLGPGGMPLGNAGLPQPGLPFGTGLLPGPMLGGFRGGFGGFGVI